MTVPAYVEDNHDIGLGVSGAIKGWMRIPGSAVNRADVQPGSARKADGDSRFDYFTQDSFFAQADFAGGVGQGRYVKNDTILSGIGDGRFQGHFFPARLAQTAFDGGSTSYLFTRAGVLYGATATHFETITDSPTATTQYDRTDGTIHCQPIETGAQNIMWVQTDTTRKVGKWTGPGGAFSFVTPTDVTPYVVCGYGRVIYCIGQRSLESSGTFVQSAKRLLPTTANNGTITLDVPPKFGNLVVVAIAFADNVPTASPKNATDGWMLADSVSDATVNKALFVYYKIANTSASGTASFDFSAAGAAAMMIAEFSGVSTTAPFIDASSLADTTADTLMTGASISAGTYGVVVNFSVNDAGDTSLTYSNGFSTVTGQAFNATADALNMGYDVDTTDVTTVGNMSSGTDVNSTIGFRQNAITTDLTQTVFMFTRDDGASWEECFQGDSAGIGVPIAAFASGGAMWITTANKFYKVVAEEQRYADELQTISLSIDDVDKYSVPFSTSSVGHVIDTFGNFMYYPVGNSIREHAPGSQTGRQFWPPPDWDTTGGAIQGMTAGEGFLAWVAGGYLWATDGRGVHCLAVEPAANAGNTLFWHAGRLYMLGDPVKYWDFKDPSTRPDISYPTTVANFTDGYIVSSYWDSEKVNLVKVVREFFLQAEWTATSTSGMLTLQYFVGDTGIHPERIGGGVTSTVTWVDVGTMTVADGNFRTFALATPIEFKKLYFRVKIEKGANGYPVVETFGANGRVKMPDQLAFTLPLWISTETVDRQGAKMYPTNADVREAVLALRALRSPTATPYYHTLQWTDGISDNTSFTVTIDNMQEVLPDYLHDTVLDVKAFVTVTELPG